MLPKYMLPIGNNVDAGQILFQKSQDMNKDSSSGQTAVVKWFLSEGGLQNMCSIFKSWKESVKFKKKKKNWGRRQRTIPIIRILQK